MSVPTPQTVQLNPLMRVLLGSVPIAETLEDNRSFELPNESYVAAMHQLAQPRLRSEATDILSRELKVDREEADRIVNDFLEHDLLTDADTDEHADAVRMWAQRGWLGALHLHLKSRNLDYEDIDTTKHQIDTRLRRLRDEEGLPSIWKIYPDAQSLPIPEAPQHQEPLQETLLRRRCNHRYEGGSLSLERLSAMLYFGAKQAAETRRLVELHVDAHPQSLYLSDFVANEIYFLAIAVDGLEEGLYHYNMRDHSIALVNKNAISADLYEMALGQPLASSGAVAFLFTGVWHRFMYRYRHARAFRNLMVATSQLVHRFMLLATSLSYSTFITPQVKYKHAEKMLREPRYEEGFLYMLTIG